MLSGINRYNFPNNIFQNLNYFKKAEIPSKFVASSLKNDIFFSGSVKNKYKTYLNAAISTIKDERALQFLKDSKDEEEKKLIVDSINSANGVYSTLKNENWRGGKNSSYGSFGAFLNDNFGVCVGEIVETGRIPSSVKEDLSFFNINKKDFIKDIQISAKYAPLNDYLKKYIGDDFLDYMYEKYYLECIQGDIKVSKNIIKRCSQINKKYGAKIFLSSDTKDIKNTLKFIEEEFNKWDKAGKDKVVYPSIVDFSTADYYWYDKKSAANNEDASAAYVDEFGRMAFCAPRKVLVEASMRHEMTHMNDEKKGKNIRLTVPEGKSLVKYHFDIFRDKLFRDELIKGGLSDACADYAYTNPEEFIAEASKGNMQAYSPELKQLLLDFGMPEWELKLEK